jgi:hypothetical protein
MQLYRKTRRRVQQLIDEARAAGYQAVRIEKLSNDPEDIVDICKLTCLEQGMTLLSEDQSGPVLRVQGHKVHLQLEPIRER